MPNSRTPAEARRLGPRALRATFSAVFEPSRDATITVLRRAGARFAFVHGSTAAGATRPDSDLDVAAWWPTATPASWDVTMPDGVDLLVLNGAPLELAGRVALHGQLLFDDDPPSRVAWQAQTRLIYLDEEDRQRALDRVFFEGRASGR